MSLVKLIREETRKDLVEKLNKHGKCALIRCTGFGKTWLLSVMTKKYKKVLYLYPAEIIKNTVKTVVDKVDNESENRLKNRLKKEDKTLDFKNIKFMTYMKLIRLTDEELQELSEFDLIIFDECHRIGAKNTKESVQKLFDYCKNSHFVGATATPERSDAFDVVDLFFSNIVVFPYTLHDAFQDGLIKKPYYCYCTYNMDSIRKDLRQAALTACQDINDIKVKEVLDSRLIEISKIYNMETIIRTVVKKYAKNKSYLKFIVFFDGFKQLDEKGNDVIEWFHNAFVNYSIDTLTVSSRTKLESDNIHLLSKLVQKKHHIDLIFCVDMLNMGYHVEDLTGIVMYRGTSSSIIYAQQLGRALSTGSNEACIVFDVVDNLHRKCVYELYDKTILDTRLRNTLPSVINPTLIDVSGLSEMERVKLRKELIEKGKKLGLNNKWFKFCNVIYEEDLIATGNEATYKELIAKVVSETTLQKCKRVMVEHYTSWSAFSSNPYPKTKKELCSTKLELPLDNFTKWQHVTMKQITDNILADKDWYRKLVEGIYKKELLDVMF